MLHVDNFITHAYEPVLVVGEKFTVVIELMMLRKSQTGTDVTLWVCPLNEVIMHNAIYVSLWKWAILLKTFLFLWIPQGGFISFKQKMSLDILATAAYTSSKLEVIKIRRVMVRIIAIIGVY